VTGKKENGGKNTNKKKRNRPQMKRISNIRKNMSKMADLGCSFFFLQFQDNTLTTVENVDVMFSSGCPENMSSQFTVYLL
jgi:hypothetical protein